MNIESTATLTKPTETPTTAASANTAAKEDSKSFKEELATVKKETKAEVKATVNATVKTEEADNIAMVNNEQMATLPKTVEGNIAQQVNQNQPIKDKNTITDKKTTATKSENSDITDPLNELNSKIEILSNLKNVSNTRTQSIGSKAEELSDKSDFCATIKMDTNDAAFFVNLVGNQEMTAINNQNIQGNNIKDGFKEIKMAETQQTVSVSQTLLDSLNESMKTNKPFRIDFGSDIAVIMKVDKNGTLSANFIPGTAAVENYLKNNIASLQQNFNNQNLPYNELAYSKQQKHEQEKQQKQNRENEDE